MFSLVVDYRKDDEFRKWYNSGKQKLARALREGVQTSFAFGVGGIDLVGALAVGLYHNVPILNATLIEHHKPGQLYAIAGFNLTCGGLQTSLAGKKYNPVKRECPVCEADIQRANEAQQRVYNDIMSSMDMGESAQGKAGSLAKWQGE